MFEKVIGKKPESPAAPAQAAQAAQRGVTPQPSQQQATAPAARRSAAPTATATSAPSGRNVLSSDVEIKGDVKFANDLVVDGKIEGNIVSDGSLTIGENAHIKAEIKTRSVVVYGKVHGNIEVSDKVELKANAELVGNIKAASLSIEPGAIFVGKSTVGTPSIKPVAAAATPAAKPAPVAKPAAQPAAQPATSIKPT